MARTISIAGLALALGGAAGIALAQGGTALAGVEGGLWELSGVPGKKVPVKQCVAVVSELAQIEHNGKRCKQQVVSNAGATATINYQCGADGFGTSKMTVLTPRSLKIETQGISDQLPFSYVVQARRLGNCAERG